MIIIMSIISVFMIMFFGVLSDINVFMTMIMIVMSPEGTSPQPTKTHALFYPFDKPIKSLYFRSFAFFFCSRVFISNPYESRSIRVFKKSNE